METCTCCGQPILKRSGPVPAIVKDYARMRRQHQRERLDMRRTIAMIDETLQATRARNDSE